MTDVSNSDPIEVREHNTKSAVKFKSPTLMVAWLDTALKKEREKYRNSPLLPDMVPGNEAAQGWAYVVIGYFLVEEAFKALLHVRGKEVPKVHALSVLFGLIDQSDRSILREYFDDYKATADLELRRFPFDTIEDFLENLDADRNERGDYIGSFDWRYFLIEQMQSRNMPLVSVDYLHEVTYGLTRIVEWIVHGRSHPSHYTHSSRLRRKHQRKITSGVFFGC